MGFSLTRLNLSLALGAGARGGATVVDVTSSGKSFPDSSTALAIWIFVLNEVLSLNFEGPPPPFEGYFPRWQPPSVRDAAKAVGLRAFAELPAPLRQVIYSTLSPTLKKPLFPVYVCQMPDLGVAEGGFHCKSGIEKTCGVDQGAAWPTPPGDVLPILFVSASARVADAGDVASSHAGWTYIQGAGDDAEHWANPLQLSPQALRAHFKTLLACATGLECREVAISLLGSKTPRMAPTNSVTSAETLNSQFVRALFLKARAMNLDDMIPLLPQLFIVTPATWRVVEETEGISVCHTTGGMLDRGETCMMASSFPQLSPSSHASAIVLVEEIASGEIFQPAVLVGNVPIITLSIPITKRQQVNFKNGWGDRVFPELSRALGEVCARDEFDAILPEGVLLLAFRSPSAAPAAATLLAAAMLFHMQRKERNGGGLKTVIDKVMIRTALAMAAIPCEAVAVDRYYFKQLTRYFL